MRPVLKVLIIVLLTTATPALAQVRDLRLVKAETMTGILRMGGADGQRITTEINAGVDAMLGKINHAVRDANKARATQANTLIASHGAQLRTAMHRNLLVLSFDRLMPGMPETDLRALHGALTDPAVLRGLVRLSQQIKAPQPPKAAHDAAMAGVVADALRTTYGPRAKTLGIEVEAIASGIAQSRN